MSYGLAKLPSEILPLCPEAEIKLGCNTTNMDYSADNQDGEFRLYDWAEEKINELISKGKQCPRLDLAKALGLTTDDGMLGIAQMPLAKMSPRHRIVARLAVEQRFESIWTLNWDMWLERAFEAVGLMQDKTSTSNLPWPTSYSTFITQEDRQKIARDKIVRLFKPHGCIDALLKAKNELAEGETEKARDLSERFMIARKDFYNWIERASPADKSFGQQLSLKLPVSPLIVVGWSVSEPYFHTFLSDNDQFNQLDELKNDHKDALTVIDPEFKQGHVDLSAKYAMDESSTHFQVVKGPYPYSTNELFQWIQVRYALSKIRDIVTESTAIKDLIDDLLQNKLEKPNSPHYTTSWVDDFLPAWSRLCWRDRYVPARDIRSYHIPNEADAHIPWDIELIDRPDLKAAANMLIALNGTTKTWHFDKHPGMILDSKGKLLIIPVPNWEPDNRQHSIVGIKALIRSFHNGNRRGPIRQISVLPLSVDRAVADQQRVEDWKSLIARYSGYNWCADASNVGTFNLSQL